PVNDRSRLARVPDRDNETYRPPARIMPALGGVYPGIQRAVAHANRTPQQERTYPNHHADHRLDDRRPPLPPRSARGDNSGVKGLTFHSPGLPSEASRDSQDASAYRRRPPDAQSHARPAAR